MGTNFNSPAEKKLGEILVEKNIISSGVLQLALDRQKKEKGNYKYIGEILLEMGVPQQKIHDALDGYKKRKPIGEIFMDLKMITPDRLQEALERQRRFAKMGIRKPMGTLLLEMGVANYHGYMEVLSKHFNMAIVSLRGFSPSASRQRAIGKAYAHRHQIVVLENDMKGIKLALAEPDPLVMNDIRRAFPSGKRVEFCLADRFEIGNCLKEI